MGSVIVTAIANGITIALVPLFLVWAARKFPSRQLQQEGPSLEELAPRYKWWDAGFTVLYMLLWIPATAAIFLPLYYLDKWRIERMHVGDDTFAFNAGALLLLPALLGAIVAAIFPLLLIQRLVLGKRNVEYDRYVELKHRIDPVRLLRLLSLVVGAAVVAMTLGFMGWYVIPARDKVIVNPLFGFERTYAYSDVADAETAPMVIAPNGHHVARRVYIIKFKDGRTLNSNHFIVAESDRDNLLTMMETIIERSGVQPVEKEFFD